MEEERAGDGGGDGGALAQDEQGGGEGRDEGAAGDGEHGGLGDVGEEEHGGGDAHADGEGRAELRFQGRPEVAVGEEVDEALTREKCMVSW